MKLREWEKIFHINENHKKCEVAILISNKIGFKTKVVIRDKEGPYIMINCSIQKEDIKIISINATNIGVLQYVRQTLTNIKGEITSSTAIVGGFNTLFSSIDGSSRKETIKK